VTATHPSRGAARQPVSVHAGEIAQLTLLLNQSFGSGAGGGFGTGGGSGVGGSFGTGGSVGTGGSFGAGGSFGTGASFGGGGSACAGTDSGPQGIALASISVGSQVEEMLIDRTRPYLYALDKVNNSLHFVNLTTKSVESTIFVGSTPVDMDVNQANNKLFIANFGSTEISIIDLETRQKGTSIFVDTTVGTWDGNPYRLASTAGDTLAFTSEDQWNDIKLVNALTGTNRQVLASIYMPDLVATADGNTVYAGESGSSGGALHRYDLIAGKLMEVDTSTETGYGTRLVIMSRDGMYIFYGGQKFLAKNLQSVLGTFSEVILASNADGSVVVGSKAVYDGTTFAIKRPLPLTTTVMALSPDDSTLYLYDNPSSKIYLYPMNAPGGG
jgi:DNA-binding beta-propeller fold protein YncE